MNTSIKPDLLLLLSGGIDSTALLHFYLMHDTNVRCIHYNYDQPNSLSELTSVEKIVKHYHVPIDILNLTIPMAYREDEVLCRNALFVLIAASLGYNPIRISIGIHARSPYYDASLKFVDDCQKILDGYFQGTIRLETPFINFTKSDIIEYVKKEHIPIELTYSCFRKNEPPCGICPSCLDRGLYHEN